MTGLHRRIDWSCLSGGPQPHRVRDQRHRKDQERDHDEDQSQLPDARDEHCAQGGCERLDDRGRRSFNGTTARRRPHRRAEIGQDSSA
jgi:hypothetical protein